tara:strand:- start:760 stop:1800 length:1041 start_codon:yes stop_codon:yes gene_type:complete
MKAAVFHAPGAPLAIEEIPDPAPGPTDLILKVKASGICGTDLHWSDSTPSDHGWRTLQHGAVMGHEFSGEVVEVGREARGNWKVGDRVCAMPQIGCGVCHACMAGKPHRCAELSHRGTLELPGAYAEYTRIGSSETIHLPDALDYRQGALVEPLAVGLHAVDRARLQPGETVLVVGAGPVGLSVALWCRFFGARHVIASDLVAGRADRAAEFGATAVINASTEDVASRFEAITGGAPHVVFECVGAPGSLQLSVDYAPVESRVLVVGLCMGADTIFPAVAFVKELDLKFVFAYRKQDFEMTIDMLGRGRLAVEDMVTDRVGFDAFPDAFQALKSPSDQIKVMLEPD